MIASGSVETGTRATERETEHGGGDKRVIQKRDERREITRDDWR